MEQPSAQVPEGASEAASEVRAKSASELADEYQVSSRTVQGWFKIICSAYSWIDLPELKTGSSAKTRYTPYCQHLIAGFRQAAESMSAEDWVASIHAQNPDLLHAQQKILLSVAEVVPLEADSGEEFYRVDRTAASSLVPSGESYLEALGEQKSELEAIEAQELVLLQRMQSSLHRLNQSQDQWSRANDLRRQRLLRQARLEAATLAIELEEEFENTRRETQYRIQTGQVPGKPQAEENPPVHSA
ncbi:hypothetical protein [Almyronema epifaneia]|uniref:Uncharacterized protein n=1 Tax=Almyronema epifaneia S1 TaxID=2991925 RepID=A0ABW6IJP1_9CYAN